MSDDNGGNRPLECSNKRTNPGVGTVRSKSDNGPASNASRIRPWRFVLLVDREPDEVRLRALCPYAVSLHDPGSPKPRIRFDVSAPTQLQAITAGIRTVESLGVRVLRVDLDDWVTAGDVGVRIGKSRETVRLWATGRLGPGGFPPPINPRRDTTFYSWSEVLPWLRSRMGYDLPEEEPAMVAANLALQLRALLPRLSQPQTLAALLR